MRVAVIAVGDELLAGDTVNTNAAWLGVELTTRGVDVERMLVVPDRVEDIADAVETYQETYDAVIVTGGVGPTHDDCTMDAIAVAFDRPLAEHDDAVEWFDNHDTYVRSDLTPETTHLPAGARMLENPVGVAPGAVVENVYVLPGVPAEMQGMFELIADEFRGTQKHVEFVYTSEPESALLERLSAVQNEYGVTVGSYPGDHVRLKVSGVDDGAVTAAASWLSQHTDPVED